VNELNQKIDGLTQTKANKQKLAGFIRAHAPANHLLRNAKPLTYAVVLKNCPNLSLPEQRKEFVDSLCPIASKDIEQLERSDKEWKAVVRSKNAANSNAESVKQSQQNITASVKSPAFIAIVKSVPLEIDEAELMIRILNCSKVVQYGRSRACKAYFEQQLHLPTFLSESIKIGYKRLPAQQFIFIPKKGFNCQQSGHKAAECKNVTLCSRCGSAEHISSRENPRSKSIFCITCKVSGHTSYSVKCLSNLGSEKKNL